MAELGPRGYLQDALSKQSWHCHPTPKRGRRLRALPAPPHTDRSSPLGLGSGSGSGSGIRSWIPRATYRAGGRRLERQAPGACPPANRSHHRATEIRTAEPRATAATGATSRANGQKDTSCARIGFLTTETFSEPPGKGGAATCTIKKG